MNAILGKVDVVDPSTGKQYKIDNYSDYHWMGNNGVIAGTKTDDSPRPGLPPDDRSALVN